MIECLSGAIGVKGCSSDEPASGLWLNELQGITLESIDKLVENEQKTYVQFISELEVNSINRFSTLFFKKLKECHQIKSRACSDDLLCANVESLYSAFRFLMARELMNYRLFTTKWNKWSMSKDQCRELKDFYQEQLDEELAIAVNTIEIDHTGECFQHGGGPVQWVTVLP